MQSLATLIMEYARDLRNNPSGSDDYPWEWAKATADYLEILLERSSKDKPLTFNNLRFRNVQRNKEWDPDGQITGAFRALEFSGEVGELIEMVTISLLTSLSITSGRIANMVKKIERERMGLPGSRVTLFELSNEFADAQITLDLLAMHYSIDLGYATRLKFNATSEKMGFKTRM